MPRARSTLSFGLLAVGFLRASAAWAYRDIDGSAPPASVERSSTCLVSARRRPSACSRRACYGFPRRPVKPPPIRKRSHRPRRSRPNSAPLGLPDPERPRSRRSRSTVGPQPDRSLHPGGPGGDGLRARPGGRSRRADPPRDVRPDRPAPDARGGRGVPADDRPDAYERLVDRLLASPHYGERWAQHWLDLAHYADSNGFELDAERPDAWRYRDWVVRASTPTCPTTGSSTLQLAGDELEPGDPTALIATGLRPLRPARGRRRATSTRRSSGNRS